jgi:hypothetical protein
LIETVPPCRRQSPPAVVRALRPTAVVGCQRLNTDDVKELQARWRSQTTAKLELARGMIQEAEKRWLVLTNYLKANSLRPDPRLIQKLSEQRPGRR